MTQDTPGHSPDETTAPPASTRWSEGPVPEDDDALAAPYVPGRPQGATPAAAEPAPTESSGDDEPFPFEVADEPEQSPAAPEPEESPAAPEPEDPFPFEEFDIEGEAAAAPDTEGAVGWTPADLDVAEPAREEPSDIAELELPEPEPEPVPGLEREAVEPTGGAGPAGEVAALLERMAALLREEGVEAVREEMDAPDRLTSLVAGLVAGYVSGRS